MTPATWTPQLAAMPPGWSPQILTLPGHGERRDTVFTAEKALAEVMNAVRSLAPVHVVGQSLGGLLAQHAAARAPLAVASLFLVSSVPVSAPGLRGIGPVMRAGGGLATRTPSRALRAAIARMAGGQAGTRAFVAEALAAWSPGMIGAAVAEIASLLSPGPYPHLGVPTTVVTGSADRLGLGLIGPLNAGWAKSVEGVTHHVVPRARHNVNQDAPETVNALLADHLASATNPSDPAKRSNRRMGASPR